MTLGVITLHPAWPFAHAHYRTRIEFGRLYGSKRLTVLKSVPLLRERNAFGSSVSLLSIE